MTYGKMSKEEPFLHFYKHKFVIKHFFVSPIFKELELVEELELALTLALLALCSRYARGTLALLK